MNYKIAIGVLALVLLLTFTSACVVVVTNAPYGTGTYNGTPIYTNNAQGAADDNLRMSLAMTQRATR